MPKLDKLCKDCRWSSNIGGLWMCENPKVGAFRNVVDGRLITVKCDRARSWTNNDECGPEGKHWEAAHEEA